MNDYLFSYVSIEFMVSQKKYGPLMNNYKIYVLILKQIFTIWNETTTNKNKTWKPGLNGKRWRTQWRAARRTPAFIVLSLLRSYMYVYWLEQIDFCFYFILAIFYLCNTETRYEDILVQLEHLNQYKIPNWIENTHLLSSQIVFTVIVYTHTHIPFELFFFLFLLCYYYYSFLFQMCMRLYLICNHFKIYK